MYIIDLKSISPQASYDNSFFSEPLKQFQGIQYTANEPSYEGMIKPSLLRRMGKSIRMGIGAGYPLLKQNNSVDGIIIGSSEGGLEDCIKFLNQIVVYNEGALTPTNFVQSTPNALAGSLALMSNNTGYNITHVHKGLAFENALIDALLLLKENRAESILVGNVEEISTYNFNIETLAHQYKNEDINSIDLLKSNTPGTVSGEGASMFIVKSNADKYIAKIADIDQISYPDQNEVIELIETILKRNNIAPSNVDALILGYNGDSLSDHWYSDISKIIFPNTPILSYKNIVGEYPTASAFATYFAAHLIAGKKAPQETIINTAPNSPQTILIYNHYKGVQHGIILLQKD